MKYFLLVYDRDSARLVEEPRAYEAGEQEQAFRDRLDRELRERDHPNMEVVLLVADSRKQLETTHARYFKTEREIAAAGV